MPAASAISRASASSAPTRAIIEPRSSASAISRPRSTTSSSASSTARTPAAASAASSPSEWPAAALGLHVVGERLPAGDRGAEDGGLLEAGALLDAREGVLADELDGSARAARGALRDEVAHLGGLAPLPGEQEAVSVTSSQRTPFRRRASDSGKSPVTYPPAGGCLTRGGGCWREQLRDLHDHLHRLVDAPGASVKRITVRPVGLQRGVARAVGSRTRAGGRARASRRSPRRGAWAGQKKSTRWPPTTWLTSGRGEPGSWRAGSSSRSSSLRVGSAGRRRWRDQMQPQRLVAGAGGLAPRSCAIERRGRRGRPAGRDVERRRVVDRRLRSTARSRR